MTTIDRAVDFILTHGAPNLRYRIRREVLGAPADAPEMRALQEVILRLPRVKKAFACQREDGFFGRVLHGVPFDAFDSTVDLLKRHGVELTDPHLTAAGEALIRWPETDYPRDHFYKAGNAMDEHGRGGFRAIIADQLVELGADEATPQVRDEINRALAAFAGSLAHTSIDDFSRPAAFRGQPCRYYIKGAPFPAANHVSLLAKTLSWRTAANLAMVRRAYAHCRTLMRGYAGGVIYVNCGHFVGPFNYPWNAEPQPLTLRGFDAHPIDFAWFMKGLSSASTTYPTFGEDDPYLAEALREWLADNSFADRLTDEQLRMFKQYAALEPAWRRRESLLCDLYFPLVIGLTRGGVYK